MIAASVANDGIMMKPSLIKSVHVSSGAVFEPA
jgi:cell division protein FtsI/penicillin-binding protein 2